jgi:GxxExxY protein
MNKINDITEAVIGAAIDVHREFRPGMLESVCEACLIVELERRGLLVEQQVPVRVHFRGTPVGCGYRMDLLVEHCVIVEVKAVERLGPVHAAQLLSYLRLSGHKVGLLINFNVRTLKRGLRRLVNGLRESKAGEPAEEDTSSVEADSKAGLSLRPPRPLR